MDELLATRLAGLQNEKEEVKLLLDLARRCQAQGPDARAETLLDILYDNQREENNPELKYLILTEFVPTQNMLRDFLEQHGILDAGQRELVLDRAMALDQEELELDDLKWVVLMVLFNQPGSEAAYAWMETQMFLDEPEPVH